MLLSRNVGTVDCVMSCLQKDHATLTIVLLFNACYLLQQKARSSDSPSRSFKVKRARACCLLGH